MNPVKAIRTILAFVVAGAGLSASLPLLVLAVPFWLVSALTGVFARRLQPPSVPQSDLVEYDRALGWKPKADQRVHVRDINGEPFLTTTDSEGWRGKANLDEAQVVAFGDSFAFGDSIADADFFAHRAPGIEAKSIGAPGYSMVQPLLLMRQLRERLRGKTVVWLVYQLNDLADNLRPEMDGYRSPFVRGEENGGWRLDDAHVGPERWPFPARVPAHEAYMEICTRSHQAKRAFGAFRFLVEEAQGALQAVDANLVVVSVPGLSGVTSRRVASTLAERMDLGDFDPEVPDREMGAVCAALGVRFVALADVLGPADYRRHDVHWNERGHRKVGALLRRLWDERDAAVSRPEPSPESAETAQQGVSPVGGGS